MTRFIGILLCLALIVLIASSLVARAVDLQVQQRIILTRDGVTLDCERYVASEGETVVHEDGSSTLATAGDVFYRNCHVAQP